MKNLDTLMANKDQFDDQSQEIIKSLDFERAEIAEINSMKKSDGWKIVERKLREQLGDRIYKLVEHDPTVLMLIELLKTTGTKSRTKNLENEISKMLPE